MDKLTPGMLRDAAEFIRVFSGFPVEEQVAALLEEAARREGGQKPENDGHTFDAVCKKCGFTHAGSTEREGLGSAAKQRVENQDEIASLLIFDWGTDKLPDEAAKPWIVIDQDFYVLVPADLLSKFRASARQAEAQAPQTDAEDEYRKGYAAGVEIFKAERDALKARVARLEDALRRIRDGNSSGHYTEAGMRLIAEAALAGDKTNG
jgi:hypothetical protein